MIDDDDDLESEEARTPGWTAVVYRWLLGIGGVAAWSFGGVYVFTAWGRRGRPHQGAFVDSRGAGPVKVRPEKPGGLKVPNQDLGIYRKTIPESRSRTCSPRKSRSRRPKGRTDQRFGCRRGRPVLSRVPTLLADAGHYRRTASRTAATKLAATKLAAPKPAVAETRTAKPRSGETRRGETRRGEPAAAKPAAAKKSGFGKSSIAAKPGGAEGCFRFRQIGAASGTGVKSRRTAKAGSFRIQLGAFRTLAKARNHGQGLKRQHRSLLGRLDMVVERVDLGAKGIFYRLRAGPIANKQTARSLCRTLGKRRINCFLVSG